MTAMFPEGPESPCQRERLLESLESYRRGLADPPLLRKWNPASFDKLRMNGGEISMSGGSTRMSEGGIRLGGGVKDEGEAGGGFPRSQKEAEADAPMTFVISSEEVDRHGDVVLAQGWRLQAYLQNPVFLWAHNYGLPVIGRALAVWPEPGQLLARLEFAPTDFARQVAALYRSGYQQGVSVGFRPLRYEERRDPRTGAFLGIRFLEQELLEVSAVPVPANRQALRRAVQSTNEHESPRIVESIIRLIREHSCLFVAEKEQ